MADWLVYWLYDDTCTHRARHGFVGVTKKSRLYVRMNQHKHSHLIPKDFRYKILFCGSRKDALAYELKLRPEHHIGWNVTIGGFPDGRGGRGMPKTPEQREKMRQAALARYADPKERERTAVAVKTVFKDGDFRPKHSGPMSDETKDKIRQRALERDLSGANNPNYRHGRYT